MSKNDYARLQEMARVKLQELKNEELKIKFRMREMEIESEREREKDKSVKLFQGQILERENEKYEIERERNNLEAKKEAGRGIIKLANKGKEILERQLSEVESNGDEERLLEVIRGKNEWTINFTKGSKTFTRTYDSKITRVSLGKFSLVDGGTNSTHISLSLESHFNGSQENVCRVYTKRSCLPAYKNKIQSVKNMIHQKEILVLETESNSYTIDKQTEAMQKNVDLLNQRIAELNKWIQEVKANDELGNPNSEEQDK